jgi:hypothetical protein
MLKNCEEIFGSRSIVTPTYDTLISIVNIACDTLYISTILKAPVSTVIFLKKVSTFLLNQVSVKC